MCRCSNAAFNHITLHCGCNNLGDLPKLLCCDGSNNGTWRVEVQPPESGFREIGFTLSVFDGVRSIPILSEGAVHLPCMRDFTFHTLAAAPSAQLSASMLSQLAFYAYATAPSSHAQLNLPCTCLVTFQAITAEPSMLSQLAFHAYATALSWHAQLKLPCTCLVTFQAITAEPSICMSRHLPVTHR
jgi:hypothetical protein